MAEFKTIKCCFYCATCDRLSGASVTHAFTCFREEAGCHKAAFKSRAARFPSPFIKPCCLFSNQSHVSCLIYGGVSSAVVHFQHCTVFTTHRQPFTWMLDHPQSNPWIGNPIKLSKSILLPLHTTAAASIRAPGELFCSKSLLAWFKGKFIYNIMSFLLCHFHLVFFPKILYIC